MPPSGTYSSSQIDPAFWRKISVTLSVPERPDGTVEMELLRPDHWLGANGCYSGARIWLEIGEMGLKGWANVHRIDPCPVIQPGNGRVVLSTMTRPDATLVSVKFTEEGDELRSTVNHPFYSLSRGEWVSACDLQRGEILASQTGQQTVATVTHLSDRDRVFNLEVESDHCYFVGSHGILSHNACVANTGGRTNFSAYETLAEVPLSGTTRSAHRMSANNAFARQLEGSTELQGLFNQQLGQNVLGHMNSGAGRNLLNPPGAVWHHPVDNPNVLQLLRSTEHTNPLLQPVLHPLPNRTGGFGKHFGKKR